MRAIIRPTAPPRSRRSRRLRAAGAGYLVFPQVALWWLDHYAGLREHLDRHCTRRRARRPDGRDLRPRPIGGPAVSTCSPVATLRTLRRFNRWFDGFTPESDSGRAPLSVNVSGYLRDESGWGAAARGYVRALRRLGVPTRLKDFSALTSNRSGDRTLAEGDALSDWDVNLMCIDAGQHFAVLSQSDEDLVRSPLQHRRVGVGAAAVSGALVRPLCLLRRDLGRQLVHRLGDCADLADPGHSHSAGHGAVERGRGHARTGLAGGGGPMSSCSCSCSTCTATWRARTRWRSSRRFDARSVHPSRFA